MYSRHQRIRTKFLENLKRYWSDGSLVIKKNSRDALLPLTSCVKSKSRKRKDDEPESIWLKNLNLENLKLYRKTSFGSYRKINLQNFLEKLKIILPEEFETKETVVKSSEEIVKNEPLQLEKKENIVASPHMSGFLIQNLETFPLLKSQCEDSLKDVIRDEKEPEMVDMMGFPSVTRILQETMPPENKERLDRWKFQMIQKMGPEKFQEYKEGPVITYENYPCDKAFIRPARKRKQIIVDIFNQGSKFHGALRKYLESREEKLVLIDQSIEGCWNSVSKVLEDINSVIMVEQAVCHPILSYKGYVDCVACYRDVPYVIEWKKTAKKVKNISKLYDAPLQACAYLGALSWQKDLARSVPKKCLLVIAYTNGDPADVFPLDLEQCQIYWASFVHRLKSFWARKLPDIKMNASHV